jgi:hypothetical protein
MEAFRILVAGEGELCTNDRGEANHRQRGLTRLLYCFFSAIIDSRIAIIR